MNWSSISCGKICSVDKSLYGVLLGITFFFDASLKKIAFVFILHTVWISWRYHFLHVREVYWVLIRFEVQFKNSIFNSIQHIYFLNDIYRVLEPHSSYTNTEYPIYLVYLWWLIWMSYWISLFNQEEIGWSVIAKLWISEFISWSFQRGVNFPIASSELS